MKTRKLELNDFKENQLERKQIKSITGGNENDPANWHYDYKLKKFVYTPPVTSPQGGGSNNHNGGNGAG